MELMQALNWRYATKRMNGKKIPDADLQKILDAIRLAPTSRGLQPFRVLVVDDPAIKAAIRPIADNQPQVVESSHLLVFAAWSGLTAKQVDDFIEYAASERDISSEKLNNMKAVLIRDQLAMNEDQFYQWASKQVYIALAFALVTAAANQIDAAAMEGFSPRELDKLLHLDKQGLKSTVLLALGYRDTENDWMLNLRKVRRKPEELFVPLTRI